MEKGFLVYKCRMCGKLNKTELCNYDGNNMGVADLIGFEKD